jgi:hypothetical protein
MGKTYDGLDDELIAWIRAQQLFFVGTAPLAADGHVNLSPKGGMDTFVVLGPRQVAYLDLTGSGAETIAHLRENGRICVMFCAFAGTPKILRLHGRGRVLLTGDPGHDALAARLPDKLGARAIVVVDVERIGTSCGYAVPRLDFVEERDVLDRWADKKATAGLVAYRREKNVLSLDGLPALDPPGEE